MRPNGKKRSVDVPLENLNHQIKHIFFPNVLHLFTISRNALYTTMQPFCNHVQGGLFTTGFEIVASLWSPSTDAAAAAGLVEFLPDGSVCLDSEDSSAHLHLSADGARVTVTYPVCVGREDTALRYEHVWCTRRVFLQADTAVPAIFRRPYCLAEKLRLERQSATAEAADADDVASALQSLQLELAALPRACEHPKPDLAPPSPAAPPSPTPCRFGLHRELYEAGNWWTEPTTALFPPARYSVAFEWTPEALYLPQSGGAGEAAAIVHADLSAIETTHQGMFLRHVDRTYAADALPPVHFPTTAAARRTDGATVTARYRLAPIATHLLTFRAALSASTGSACCSDHNHSGAAAVDAESAPAPPTPSCSDRRPLAANPHPAAAATPSGVHQTVSTEHGTFTAFQDGSVVIRFADRTILSWNRRVEPHVCRIITAQGEARHVPTSPGREALLGEYVTAATQFAQWAFTSAEVRAEAIHRRACVEAEVHRTLRGALVCEVEKGASFDLQRVIEFGTEPGSAEGPPKSKGLREADAAEADVGRDGHSVQSAEGGGVIGSGEIGPRALEELMMRNAAMLRALQAESEL